MTTLYRPVQIETEAQADALPVGTVAFDPETTGLVGIRTPESSYFPWHCSLDHDPTAYSSNVVGWLALVPIEAEESWSEDYGGYHLLEATTGPHPFIAYMIDREEA